MTVRRRWPLAIALLATGCMLDLPDAPDPPVAPNASTGAGGASVALVSPSEFVGRFETNWGVLTISLANDGKGLVGYYGDPHQGRLAGAISGKRFAFFWKGDDSQTEGHGFFERTSNGLLGRWGYGSDESGVGTWCGCAAAASAPAVKVECSETRVDCR